MLKDIKMNNFNIIEEIGRLEEEIEYSNKRIEELKLQIESPCKFCRNDSEIKTIKCEVCKKDLYFSFIV